MSMFAESIRIARNALATITQRPGHTIVQVGSHVGNNGNDCLYQSIMTDPHKSDSFRTIVLIEPVPEFFAQLKESYRDVGGVFFENIAISDNSGRADFYYLALDASKHGYVEWLNQLGSLGKDLLLRDSNGKPYEWHEFYLQNLTKIQVQCKTLGEVLHEHNIQRLDALFIDAEGYDGRILATLDLKRMSPSYIQFESSLISPMEKKTTVELLINSGYRVKDAGFDTIACAPDLLLEGFNDL